MPVAAGSLRHRVTLHAPAGTRGTGDPATASNLATGIPVKIESVPLQFQQQERIAAGGINSQTLYTITMRYRSDVAKDLVLVEECCTERTFQIVSMIPSDKLDWLDLTCVVAG
jgi:head-tail adaptor